MKPFPIDSWWEKFCFYSCKWCLYLAIHNEIVIFVHFLVQLQIKVTSESFGRSLLLQCPPCLSTYQAPIGVGNAWNTVNTLSYLALIGCLCHEVCDGFKGIVKVCVGSLKSSKCMRRWTEMRCKYSKSLHRSAVNINSLAGHLHRFLFVLICAAGGLGSTGARPVHTTSWGLLQHLQAQAGWALQRGLQPGPARHG